MAKITGRQAFEQRAKRISPAARAEMRKALEENANELAAVARSLAPVATGRLRSSIVAGPGDHDLQFVVTAGGPEAFYAMMVEFGTSRTAPQSYWRPAKRLLKKKAKSRYRAALRRAVKGSR